MLRQVIRDRRAALLLAALIATIMLAVVLIWMLGARYDLRLAVAASSAVVAASLSAGTVGALVVWKKFQSSVDIARSVAIREVHETRHSLVREIRDTRTKQSRHEYHHGAALTRIEGLLEQVRADAEAQYAYDMFPTADALVWTEKSARLPRVLFVTSNGAGMGHLSRCLAVCRELQGRASTSVLTLSSAHAVVSAAGFPVRYFESPDATPWSRQQWHRRFAAYLRCLVADERPTLVVFDGTFVYRGVTEACRRTGTPLVWMRRGLWKEIATMRQVENPLAVADAILVPGELGLDAVPPLDKEAFYVSPITQARSDTASSREEALETLNLDAHRRYVLIQPGQATINGISPVQRLVELISENGEFEPVVVVSPVAGNDEFPSARVVVGRYPLAPLLSAFDFAVTAAGYNSIYENLEMSLPGIYIPNNDTLTDDQGARAALIQAHGVGIAVTTPSELDNAVARMMSETVRGQMAGFLGQLPRLQGAREAADYLLTLAHRFGVSSVIGCEQP